MRSLVAIVLAIIATIVLADGLQRFNVDPTKLSTAGLSSGAYFAVQFQIAHSKKLLGAGVVAGGPYYCAEGSMIKALTECMSTAFLIKDTYLAEYTKSISGSLIDDVANIAKHNIYAFSGELDAIVNQGVMKKLVTYYGMIGANASRIQTNFNVPAQHSFVTDHYGNPCYDFESPFINNCNFDLAGAIMKHIYGDNLKNRVEQVESNLKIFSQAAYNDSNAQLDTEGFIYVPTGCQSNKTACSFQVLFHGCKQGKEFIGDVYAKHTGMNEWAEANNIIILYPQVKSNQAQNQNGCFDWWGYVDQQYHTKKGVQMTAIAKMVQDATGVYMG